MSDQLFVIYPLGAADRIAFGPAERAEAREVLGRWSAFDGTWREGQPVFAMRPATADEVARSEAYELYLRLCRVGKFRAAEGVDPFAQMEDFVTDWTARLRERRALLAA